LRAAGARAVLVTRGPESALIVSDDHACELILPRFDRGSREGCGDTMMGALAAGLATGRSWQDALVLSAAAGAANCHRDAVGEVERAIVDAGQDVAMQIDQVTSEGGDVELSVVAIEKPEDLNVIVGQAHFIKTVEDLHEALAGTSPHLRFGLAFNEASGPRLVRRSGNDDELVELATRNALALGAGHVFVIFLREGFPVNVLNQVKQVPEVCAIFCATANPVGVVIAETEAGRGVAGVIDGAPPLDVESDADVAARKSLLRAIGYKL
jgi:adenosine/AMP kinase